MSRRSENHSGANAGFVACADADGIRVLRSIAGVRRNDELAEHRESLSCQRASDDKKTIFQSH